MICPICWCANICLIGSPIKNLCAQVSHALQNISAIWGDQTYTHNNCSEHQSTCNRGHQTFLRSLRKVSSGQIYLGIIEGPSAFLLSPPNVVNGPVIRSGERLGQACSSKRALQHHQVGIHHGFLSESCTQAGRKCRSNLTWVE